MNYSTIASPIGDLLFTWEGQSLSGVYMESHKGGPTPTEHWHRDDTGMAPMREQLTEYFAGVRQAFDLPLHFRGTEFQRRVWDALLAIPFGTTTTYTEIAQKVGAEKAVRAVGAAVGRNPISIIVPCHRVLGANGSLTGFAGGLDRKHWLLGHERGPESAPSRIHNIRYFDFASPETERPTKAGSR